MRHSQSSIDRKGIASLPLVTPVRTRPMLSAGTEGTYLVVDFSLDIIRSCRRMPTCWRIGPNADGELREALSIYVHIFLAQPPLERRTSYPHLPKATATLELLMGTSAGQPICTLRPA